MKVLAVETSADETAVAVLETTENGFFILADTLFSQARLHTEYGGIYPALAKREHQKNLVPLTKKVLKESGLLKKETKVVEGAQVTTIREERFREEVKLFLQTYATPDIDLIAVTVAPGLEIALWNGITFAQSLSEVWNIPVVGINHLEGHIVAALVERKENVLTLNTPIFPILSLLISGGHTELLLMKEWFVYEHVGKTRDDAVGEAFDKVARILGLPYPGGPEIARVASRGREKGLLSSIPLPRPMINEDSCDFSFSGLKTAVLYRVRDTELNADTVETLAMEFENSARDVLVSKVRRALHNTSPATLAVGGGVSANAHIREGLEMLIADEFPHTTLHYPAKGLTGDNAIMIGVAALLRHKQDKLSNEPLVASGSRTLAG